MVSLETPIIYPMQECQNISNTSRHQKIVVSLLTLPCYSHFSCPETLKLVLKNYDFCSCDFILLEKRHNHTKFVNIKFQFIFVPLLSNLELSISILVTKRLTFIKVYINSIWKIFELSSSRIDCHFGSLSPCLNLKKFLICCSKKKKKLQLIAKSNTKLLI